MNQKKERRIFSKEFRLSAVERMIAGESPSALARELGVLRKSLYEWKDTYAKLGEAGLARQTGWSPPILPSAEVSTAPASNLAARGELLRARARIEELERKVGKQELELDFFDAALQRIRALGAKNKEKNFAASSPINPSKAN
jgi:transposase